MKLSRLMFSALAAGVLVAAPVFADNAVLYWNEQALNTTRLARNPPPMSALFLATSAIRATDAPTSQKNRAPAPDPGRGPPQVARPPLMPLWGKVTPCVLTSPDQFRAPPPESLGSKEYAEELNFVAKRGARDNADRSEYETLSTPFWNDDLGTCTPPGHWNMIAGDLARRNKLGTADTARLFALLNFAEADAGIACWETKFYYNVWRPENALREMEAKINPGVKVDPDFIPNRASPPFPSYTSGHSTFSAAGARLLAMWFGTDDIEFSVTSDALPGAVRSFRKLSDAPKEAGT